MIQTDLTQFLKEDVPEYGETRVFIRRPWIKKDAILERRYQVDIARHALQQNTAVILPTGLGKTIIAILVMADVLPKKILFLAPTKPLVHQHFESCRRILTIDEGSIQMLSGAVTAKKRTRLFNQASIIVATPQTISHDLMNKRYTLDNIGLVIFDEMHRAVERYAYVAIARQCECRVLGLTASPGSTRKKIAAVLTNLRITHVESRTRDDADVKDYVKDITLDWIKVPLDAHLQAVRKPLQALFLEKIEKLNKLGILSYKKPEYLSKKDILGARATIQQRFRNKPFVFATYNNHTVLLHAYHCLELVETQGIDSFLKYTEAIANKPKRTRAEQMFLTHPSLQHALALARKGRTRSHPKLAALQQIVSRQFEEDPEALILIFTQYRDTIDSIEAALRQVPRARFHRFVGQAGQGTKKGMSQKEQHEIINEFRERTLNVLIATSIGEEGIDIPHVNRVIFYEPIPSEIRGIQRKGRTGRSHVGNVTILITEHTRDEAYFYVEQQKERKMYALVQKMK